MRIQIPLNNYFHEPDQLYRSKFLDRNNTQHHEYSLHNKIHQKFFVWDAKNRNFRGTLNTQISIMEKCGQSIQKISIDSKHISKKRNNNKTSLNPVAVRRE